MSDPKEYKPSPQGKVSAGIAASVVGYAAYKTHLHNKYPKSAQTGVKVPSSGNMPPRGAAPSATAAANFYSTRARATVTAQSLENSYRMPAQAARGEGATGLLGAAQRASRGIVGAGRWLIGGISATTLALSAVGGSAILGVWEGFFTRGTLTGADEAIALSRARQKQLGLLHVSDSLQQLNPPPFKGGQDVNGLYRTWADISFNGGATWLLSSSRNSPTVGRVLGLRKESTGGQGWQYRLYIQPPNGNAFFQEFATGQDPAFRMRINRIERLDGLPDTAGDPPSEFGESNSSLGNLIVNPDNKQIAVGEVSSPPPALISRAGDPLYDAARVPLQWVMDGTPPPWARNEPSVARLPGARTVPAAPAAPANIPQPDVAPSPNKDSRPANPYPFFDPVTFPDTTTPDIFDIPPAFTPKPLTVEPIVVEPIRPTTDETYKPDPIKFPNPVPTGTRILPNPTTRNPEPVPEISPKLLKQAPTPPDPSKDFPGWWTAVGLAGVGTLLSPTFNPTLFQGIETAAKNGTCQSLNGGCTTGNVNQQLANNGTKLDAINTGLQALDLSLLGTIDQKLGSQIPNGGIGGFLTRAFQATRLDKIINALTLITTLHNAAMLSKSLGQTLGDLTSQALSAIGIKDENNSPLDINAELGRQVNNFMSQLLGADVWTGTKLNWTKASAILSSANQIIWTVRSIADSGREVTEWIANNTGKIGNALKRFRVVGENAYPHMAENVSHQNAWMLKVQRYREGLDTLDDAASSLQGVLGEVQNIQQEAGELMEQKQRFDAAIASAQPKTIPDNDPVKDKASATKQASASPTTQADVFRGAGEIDNA